ncbi:MAG: ABC transporter permease, partial [Anaerolineales bacterium]
MFNSRLLSLIRKEFIQIVRDPRTLALTFVLPVVQILLLGYAATNDVRNVPLAVFDQDKSPASRSLQEAYRAADYFRLTYDVNSEDELAQLVNSGAARAGLIIPPDYGQRLAAGQTAQAAFVIDGSDPTVAGTALSAAVLIGQAKSTRLSVERLAARGQAGAVTPAIEVRTRVWYNPDLVSAYYMIPALIGVILQFLTVILTATAIVRE